MKLKFTHKTWYFFLLCAAASMLNGFAVLGGMDFSFLEMVAFCITGITILFLAAEKGYVDEIILPEETVPRLRETFRLLRTKQVDKVSVRRHGNMPL